MLLHVLADEHIRLETAGDAGLAVEGEPFGPLQMLATSLALCTASVIQSYAETANLDAQGFAVEVRWVYAEDPHRVGQYHLTLHLPSSLPAARHRAVLRAAEACTVHATLLHQPAIDTDLQTFDPAEADPHAGHQHHAEHEHHTEHEPQTEHRHEHEA